MYDQYMNQMFPRKQVEKIGEIYLYVTERGDNLYQIAKNFNTRMELIAALNNMQANDTIYPGNQLLIPVVHEQYMDNAALTMPQNSMYSMPQTGAPTMPQYDGMQNEAMYSMPQTVAPTMPQYDGMQNEAMLPYQSSHMMRTINPYDTYY